METAAAPVTPFSGMKARLGRQVDRSITVGLVSRLVGFFSAADFSVFIQFRWPAVKNMPMPSSYCCFKRLKLSMMTPMNRLRMKKAPRMMNTTK